MKRCPQCNRVETDDALVFCRADGTALVRDSSSPISEAGTAQLGSDAVSSEIETSILPDATNAGLNRPTARTTVLPSQPPVATAALANPKRRRLAFALVAVLAIVIAIACYFYFSRKTNASIQSIAVLPFVNESGNQDVEYLSDGMTESLINSLSQLPKLNVKAHTSVFRYKGKGVDTQTVGRELNVQAILNGRVLQRGDDVVLYLELVDTQTGNRIWGDQYNKKLANLVSLQNEIALDVAQKLKTKLSGAEEQRVTKNYTANSEAYQLYLKGRYFWNKRTVDDFNRAIPYFQQAIDKDPNYALAYSGLADSYTLSAVFGVVPPKDLMPQAKAAATKSLALDDSLAEAHASLGEIMAYYDWDFAGAEHEFRRAIELNPNYATAHQWLAELLSVLRRHDEALAEIHQALQLDSFSLIINRVQGETLFNARRYDEAITQCRKTLEMDPNFPTTHNCLARSYEAKGIYDRAVGEFLAIDSSRGVAPETLDQFKAAYANSGWHGFLVARLNNLLERAKKDYVRPFTIAGFYARLGQKDEAFAWLDKAFVGRDYQMTELNVRPELDPLRADPRFSELVRRVGLPQ